MFIIDTRLIINTFIPCSLVPDPCVLEPCDPNAHCQREGLLSDNFRCSCSPPFTVGDGFNCSCEITLTAKSPIILIIIIMLLVPDPCLSGPCDPNAVCQRDGLLNGNFTCTCLSPFIVGDGFNCSGKST